MKTASEIRDYLLTRLRCALLRPSMCGGEPGILSLMDHVTFVDECDEEWQRQRSVLHYRKAFNARGVTGGFERMFGFRRYGAHDNEVASVYAVIAHHMGYLSLEGQDRLNRVLSTREFDSLLESAMEFTQIESSVPQDVIERFGEPSIRWGTNDNYPCTLLYLCESDRSRYVHFDFWAEWFQNERGFRVPGKYGPQPLLRNIRVPATMFADEFVLTPWGESLRRVDDRMKSSEPGLPETGLS